MAARALGIEAGAVVLSVVLVQTLPEEIDERDGTLCPVMDVFQADLAILLSWAAAAAGGPAVAAAFALANRNVWLGRSLLVMLLTLALPYVAFAAYVWAALSTLD